MAEDDPNSNKMAALEESVRRLEAKLAQLGEAPPSQPTVERPKPPVEDPAPVQAELELDRPLAGAAVLCVVLACALLLRRSADASWVAPPTAPMVGIGYCALLLAVSAALFPRAHGMAALVGHSALVLGFLIVLESHLGRGTLPLSRAYATLGGLAVGGTVLAWARKSPSLAGVALIGAASLVAFVAPGTAVFADVAFGLVIVEVVTLVLAHRLGWTYLRWPLFAVAQSFAFMWALYLRAKGLDVPRLAGFPLGLAAIEIPFLGAVVFQTIFVRRRLDVIETSIPLAATAIPLALLAIARVPPRVELAALLSVLLLGFGAFRAVRRAEHTAGGAFVFAGALHAAWWWPLLPVPLFLSGGALALLALTMFAVGRRAGARSHCAVAHVLQAALVARLVHLGAIYVLGSGTSSIVLASLIGVVAVGQYFAARVLFPPKEPDRESIVAAVAGAVALYGAMRVGADIALHSTNAPALQTCQSVSGSLLIACALGAAALFRLGDLLEVAVVALVLLGAKIIFYDTFTLPPALAMPAVAVLAACLGLASWAIQRHRKGNWARQSVR